MRFAWLNAADTNCPHAICEYPFSNFDAYEFVRNKVDKSFCCSTANKRKQPRQTRQRDSLCKLTKRKDKKKKQPFLLFLSPFQRNSSVDQIDNFAAIFQCSQNRTHQLVQIRDFTRKKSSINKKAETKQNKPLPLCPSARQKFTPSSDAIRSRQQNQRASLPSPLFTCATYFVRSCSLYISIKISRYIQKSDRRVVV